MPQVPNTCGVPPPTAPSTASSTVFSPAGAGWEGGRKGVRLPGWKNFSAVAITSPITMTLASTMNHSDFRLIRLPPASIRTTSSRMPSANTSGPFCWPIRSPSPLGIGTPKSCSACVA